MNRVVRKKEKRFHRSLFEQALTQREFFLRFLKYEHVYTNELGRWVSNLNLI